MLQNIVQKSHTNSPSVFPAALIINVVCRGKKKPFPMSQSHSWNTVSFNLFSPLLLVMLTFFKPVVKIQYWMQLHLHLVTYIYFGDNSCHFFPFVYLDYWKFKFMHACRTNQAWTIPLFLYFVELYCWEQAYGASSRTCWGITVDGCMKSSLVLWCRWILTPFMNCFSSHKNKVRVLMTIISFYSSEDRQKKHFII